MTQKILELNTIYGFDAMEEAKESIEEKLKKYHPRCLYKRIEETAPYSYSKYWWREYDYSLSKGKQRGKLTLLITNSKLKVTTTSGVPAELVRILSKLFNKTETKGIDRRGRKEQLLREEEDIFFHPYH